MRNHHIKTCSIPMMELSSLHTGHETKALRKSWSDFVFHKYLQKMKSGESMSSLRTVIQTDIFNQGTKNVARTAYEAQTPPLDFVHGQSHGWTAWTFAEQPYFFCALLGTDNAKGVVHLLTDHSLAMEKKKITSIRTRNDLSLDIRIELGPYTPW